MNVIESMVTGRMPMQEFMSRLRSDPMLQAEVNALIPLEASQNPQHPLWTVYSYSVMQGDCFLITNLLKRIEIPRHNGTLGDSFNKWSTISRFYCFWHPEINPTSYYKNASLLFLDACAEQYEGPEVLHYLEQIIVEHLPIQGKSARIKATKEALRKGFHVKDKKKPYWIQGSEWPMGKNSPMEFVERKRISDGVQFTFRDVDTNEQRNVIQFY